MWLSNGLWAINGLHCIKFYKYIHTWHTVWICVRCAHEPVHVIIILTRGLSDSDFKVCIIIIYFLLPHRKLVAFGLLHNLIRCINKYPICTDTPVGRQKVYNGMYNIDEICCKTGLLPSKIEQDIDSDPFLTVVWK